MDFFKRDHESHIDKMPAERRRYFRSRPFTKYLMDVTVKYYNLYFNKVNYAVINKGFK